MGPPDTPPALVAPPSDVGGETAKPDAAASGLAVSPSTSGGGETSGGGASGGPILLAIAAAGLGVGGLLGYVRRRRTLRAPGAPDQDPPEAAP